MVRAQKSKWLEMSNIQPTAKERARKIHKGSL